MGLDALPEDVSLEYFCDDVMSLFLKLKNVVSTTFKVSVFDVRNFFFEPR